MLIKVERVKDSRVLVIFRGKVDTEEARKAALEVKTILDEVHEPIELWFDVREVKSYPSGARDAWQRTILPAREKLSEIGVASRSSLTTLGGTLFAMFLRVNYRALTDDDLSS